MLSNVDLSQVGNGAADPSGRYDAMVTDCRTEFTLQVLLSDEDDAHHAPC